MAGASLGGSALRAVQPDRSARPRPCRRRRRGRSRCRHPRRPTRVPGLERLVGRRAQAGPGPFCRRDRPPCGRLLHAGEQRCRRAAVAHAAWRRAAGDAQHHLVRRPCADAAGPCDRHRAGAPHRAPRSGRGGGDHHAVERTADAVHLEARPGAGGRQLLHPEAAGVGAADEFAAGRCGACGRSAARSLQRRAGQWREHRRQAGQRPAPGAHLLHRQRADGQVDRAGGRRQPRALQPGTRRQEPVHRARGCRRRQRRRHRGTDVPQRGPGLPGGHALPGARAHCRGLHRRDARAGRGTEGRRPARQGHRGRSDHSPAPGGACRRLRRPGGGRRRQAAVGRCATPVRRPVLPADDADRTSSRTTRSCRTRSSARC